MTAFGKTIDDALENAADKFANTAFPRIVFFMFCVTIGAIAQDKVNGERQVETGWLATAVAACVFAVILSYWKRELAPVVSRDTAWILAALAWYGALIAGYPIPDEDSHGFVIAVVLVAIVYAIWIQPRGAQVQREQEVNELADAIARRLAPPADSAREEN